MLNQGTGTTWVLQEEKAQTVVTVRHTEKEYVDDIHPDQVVPMTH